MRPVNNVLQYYTGSGADRVFVEPIMIYYSETLSQLDPDLVDQLCTPVALKKKKFAPISHEVLFSAHWI